MKIRLLFFASLVLLAVPFSGAFSSGSTDCGGCEEVAFIHFEDLERGSDVTGLGTVHPDLNIATIHFTDMPIVIETGFGDKGSCFDPTAPSCMPFAFGAPNDMVDPTNMIANNCLEDEFGHRVQLTAPWPEPGVPTAKGFADVERRDLNTPQELRFTFNGRRVKSFEILVLDWGDFNKGPDFHGDPLHDPRSFHHFGLYAFADPTADHHDTNWIASDAIAYRTEPVSHPRSSYNPSYGDLWFTGDACSMDEGMYDFPGNHRLRVESEEGIGVVYLMGWDGADPHVGFDSIRLKFFCEDRGDEGCSPGYWKNHEEDWPATGYAPTDSYAATFGVNPSFAVDELMDVLEQGGGGEKALGRQAVAALLNAAHPDVEYGYSTASVIDLVQHAYASGHIDAVKEQLEEENQRGATDFCD